MQVTVDIPDELVARIEADGTSVSRFAQSAVDEKLPSETATSDAADRVTSMRAFLQEMAQFSDRIPVLPDYAYTRESFYEDHD